MRPPHTRIDVLASAPQYLDHLAPVWHALPKRSRGGFIVPDDLVARAADLSITAEIGLDGPNRLTRAASIGDLRRGDRLPVRAKTGGASLIARRPGEPIRRSLGRFDDHPAECGERDVGSLDECLERLAKPLGTRSRDRTENSRRIEAEPT